MQIETDIAGRADRIAQLFRTTFTASEGAEEGALIGDLAQDLLATTPPQDIRVFLGIEAGALIAAAIFTRLAYPEDRRQVFLLSPMAVVPDRQGKGVGQTLLRGALEALTRDGIDAALTYGDPAYYARVGFAPITAQEAAPPLSLSMPEGWLGQSLTGEAVFPLQGPSRSAPALDHAAFW
nr:MULTISPECIES: N-acetyltransferase [unclassified Roseivivax]